MMQYSLFGAAATAAGLDDLDGLLLAGGQWVRSPHGARLSIVVGQRWRADALQASFAELDVPAAADPIVAAASGFGVRTAFTERLVPRAAHRTRGARLHLPAGFELGVGALRLWAIAAGRHDATGYLLITGPSTPRGDDPLHRAAGIQLARLGVAAVSLARGSGRSAPGWRVTSARRLRRLGELLGPPPDGCGTDWPSPALAAAR